MAERFARGTTIRISTETVDYNDTLYDPGTSLTVTIIKGSTTVLTATSILGNRTSTGKYYYRWQSSPTSSTGKYQVKITAVHTGYTSIEHDEQAFYLY